MQIIKEDTWVKPFLKHYKKTLILACFLGFLTFFAAGALMFTSGYLISKSAARPENILMIYVPVVLTRAFGILRPSLRYLERLISHNWVLKMTSSLRKKLYLSLENGSFIFNSKLQLGQMLGLLSEDIGHLQNLYLRTIFPMVIALCLYIFIVIALGFFSLFFALFMFLLLFVLLVLFPLVSLLRLGKVQEEVKIKKNALYTHLTDNVLGVSDWVLSGRSQDFVHSMEEKQAQLRKSDKHIQDFHRKKTLLLEFFFAFIVLCLLLWTQNYFGGQYAGSGNWIAAFVLSAFPLIDAFAPISEAVVESNIYKNSIEHFNELPKIQDEELARTFVTPDNLDLKAENLSFTYEEKDVLNDLNISIPFGQKIAILGKSGAGKSTLAKLLRGDLIAQNGKIQLGNLDIQQFGENITDYISVLHQTPYLFATTIRNNLRIANSNATDQEIWQVLEMVGLKTMIEQLPEQLSTQVDEAGLRFSGGERHRLALARILLKDTPIVIMDEATVGLDPITENVLLESFFTALEGKTLIWITHHLLGTRYMDRVIFLEDGKVHIDGKPDELAQTNGHYQKLLELDRGWS